MSSEVELSSIEVKAAPTAPARWWAAVDRAMVWGGDRLNPILVKETRQALKSRQFVITFALLLLCGWVWSILGVAMIGPDIWYGAQGADMFFGYYAILAFPLTVIVPFGAFRSLAGEQEDRTYELMSITGLGPRQIIRGKLGSAVLQMLIYLSAISPCLAFTYMLRGIDAPTILFILLYLSLGSLALSVIGLLAGTLTSEKHWQVVLSVVLIAGLFYAFGMSFLLAGVTLAELHGVFLQPEFWQANAAFLTGYAGYFALLFYAAAAQLSFTSDNRSTRLRITMVVQHVLLTGWMAWLWIWPAQGEEELPFVFLMFLGIHWWVMGALMTGESPELSPRVKRQLPQSFLGRVFLTWLNPGPGTGYMLAVSGMLAGLVTVGMALMLVKWIALWSPQNWRFNTAGTTLPFGILGFSYATFYLGLGLLVIRLLRRFTHVGILLAALVQVLVLLLGCGVPMIIYMLSTYWYDADYSLLQITNPFWSLMHVVDRSALPPEGYVLLAIVPLAALLVFVLNLGGIVREVRNVRIAKPRRVAEEDAELAAVKVPPEPVKKSPWD
ncbi:MAG: hypothetical protein JXB62_01750 [Pirellulales bacterium]|nr:hypothetical protein [Pirellulales bacterium]